ncbi:hypothetical protein R1sor_005041 [Riccia sorocarpa]|uniref:Phytocyanin domain-containing protein n=1 Tax=Riccia sorocarpa TaxID=122646 RepID=A0ABD3HM76_9MARC
MTGFLRLICSACLALLLASALFAHVNAVTYNVGNDLATWTIPATTNELNYTNWAASINFRFGDEILFTYSADLHSVHRVNSTDYETCSMGSPIATFSSGHDIVPLSDPGVTDYYFVCGTSSHCFLGQRLKLSLVGLVPSSPAVDPSTQNPPASNSAPPSSVSLPGCIELAISATLILIVQSLISYAP